MYTTFILDEIGNRKIIMDWRGNPPFQWNEIKIESLLSSHPNTCDGLDFAHFWTGDDWHAQHDIIVSPEFGYLPDFKVPDLPAPRTRLESEQTHTRASNDKDAPSHLPVRIEATADDPMRGRPRIRCGLCAWNLGVNPSFSQTLPAPDTRPPKPPPSNRFAQCIQQLIAEGRTSREALANTFSHKGRWRNIDRWLQRTGSKRDRLHQPTKEQLQTLSTAIDSPPMELLQESIQADLEHFQKRKEWENWRLFHTFPQWAHVEVKADGLWYHHHHCGRATHDLSEVTKIESVHVNVQEDTIPVLVEHWKNKERVWKSYALCHAHLTIAEETIKKKVEALTQSPLSWFKTDRFLFGTTGSIGVHR